MFTSFLEQSMQQGGDEWMDISLDIEVGIR